MTIVQEKPGSRGGSMGLHALVALPRGRAPEVEYDAVYADYLKPGLEDAGFEVTRAGDAHTPGDSFKTLLLADLVVVDLSLPAPDIWYELGLRHALLTRGVLLAARAPDASAKDGNPGRANTLHYHLKDGRPDAQRLAAQRQALAGLALSNAASWRARPAARDAKDGAEARRVFLFSGHMIDAPERAEPRFPADKESIAAGAIAATLDALRMGENDLAICGGACGGDLLFAEAALRRGCPLHLHLQFAEPEFLRASVAFAGEPWVARYRQVKAHRLTRIHLQPEEMGPLGPGMNPYVRNNVWQLCTALVCGGDTIRFIALWDGEGGSDPGGTQNMVETVRRYAGQVHLLDTRQLFGLLARRGDTR
jgi:hypothetical protein